MRRADGLLRVWLVVQIAAEPYQTISFKIQAREIDSASLLFLSLLLPLARLARPGLSR